MKTLYEETLVQLNKLKNFFMVENKSTKKVNALMDKLNKELYPNKITLNKAKKIINQTVDERIIDIQYEDGSGKKFNYLTDKGWKFIDLSNYKEEK